MKTPLRNLVTKVTVIPTAAQQLRGHIEGAGPGPQAPGQREGREQEPGGHDGQLQGEGVSGATERAGAEIRGATSQGQTGTE